MRLAFLGLACVGALALGCGGTTSDQPSDAGADVDASKPKPRDAGVDTGPPPYVPQGVKCVRDPNAVPPAPFAEPADGGVSDGGADGGDAGLVLRPPQVRTPSGTTARLPVFVPVTFDGDDQRDPIEDFIDSVGCTDYWRSVATDYGVGDGIGGPPVHLSETAPAQISDDQIQSWLLKKLASDPSFGKPDENTVYAIFYPDGTSVNLYGSKSCQSFGAYHQWVNYQGKNIGYAVMPRCGSLRELTVSTSHELLEFVSDPSGEGYYDLDAADSAWGILGGSEIGDMCEFNKSSNYTPDNYPFAVQRSWSNRAAYMGENPCQPADSDVWFAAAPVLPDLVQIKYEGQNRMAQGVKLAQGNTTTIDVQVIANGSIAGFNVDAMDASTFYGGKPVLTLTLDKTYAHPGDTLKLTITRLGTSSYFGSDPFILRSTQGYADHMWWGVVGD